MRVRESTMRECLRFRQGMQSQFCLMIFGWLWLFALCIAGSLFHKLMPWWFQKPALAQLGSPLPYSEIERRVNRDAICVLLTTVLGITLLALRLLHIIWKSESRFCKFDNRSPWNKCKNQCFIGTSDAWSCWCSRQLLSRERCFTVQSFISIVSLLSHKFWWSSMFHH